MTFLVVTPSSLVATRAYNVSPAMPFRLTGNSGDRNALSLAGLRIAVGFLFLILGQYKVFGTLETARVPRMQAYNLRVEN